MNGVIFGKNILAFIGHGEFSVFSNSAYGFSDNTLITFQNSSYPTRLHSKIVKYATQIFAPCPSSPCYIQRHSFTGPLIISWPQEVILPNTQTFKLFFVFVLIEIHTLLTMVTNITDNTNINLVATSTTYNIHAVICTTYNTSYLRHSQ